jgi:PAS domain S-box-containing protein
MSGTVLDVTEQHEAQRTISRALERLTDAQRIGQIGDWEMDLATQAINWSPQVFEIFGRDPALGAPKNYEDLKPMLEPASWALQVEKVARVIETAESQDYELVGVRPDGTRVIIQARAVARKGGDGRVVGLRGTVQNITERKKLEQQFLRVQRQESVGTLAGGVAHDLNNLLAPIMLVLPMLRDKIPDAEREELLTMVDQSVKRAAKIIKQLLTFGRGIEGERRQVNVGALGREMVELMRQTFPREITVREKIPGGLWPIRADATQIHQVLMNLCVNARDAMPKGGLLTITAQNTMISGMEAGPHPPAKPGPHVCLTISDMGEGIARANIDRIFEPFFTTKAIGQGSGLGLPTVLGIVKSHGGYVTVYSELRRGTSFKVYLPASVDVAATIEREPARPPVGAGELILVVDDEATIRQALTLTLQNGRYRVVAAADGREALQLLTEAADRPQLVMTDIMMPEMSGIELIAAIRSLSPDLPVIATTGLHDQVRQEELAVLGVSQVLAKPCSVEDILAAVHRTLAAKI